MSLTITSSTLSLPVSARDHWQGRVDAPLTLVEYGDFECAFCGQAFPVVKAVQRRLKDRLCFVFRHLPLTQVHPHAQQAAEAAEAAGAQGMFWEMHDLLFRNRRSLDDAHLVGFAAELGLDTQRFLRDMTDHVYAAKVNEDRASAVQSGTGGTPTFFVNGQRHDGAADLDSLVAAIERVP